MDNKTIKLRQFGPFKLDAEKRVLWHRGEPVDLALKEIDLLCVLTESSGEVVTKAELLDRVWHDSFVEESNLSRHIYVLRKMFKDLGEDDIIQTVSRRGYRFVGDIREITAGDLILEKHTRTRTMIEITEEEQKALSAGSPGKLMLLYKATPALVLVVLAATGFAIWRYSARSTAVAAHEIRSVAVLPLRSFSDVDVELRLRITDALITKLGNLKNVSISPTNSIVRFSRPDTDAIEAGRKLEVDAVVDGRIQTEGDRVRVTLQLISTKAGEQIWSGQFDGKVDEILKLQDAIAAALVPKLSREQFVARGSTTNAEAYEDYLKGRYLWNKRQNSELRKAATYFERAIALDPNFSLAYAGLADTYSQLANDGSKPDGDVYAKAKAMANKSLEIDPDLSEGYAALGWIAYIHEWNWTEAERALARAIELNPNNADAHHWRGLNFRVMGRMDDFASELGTARRLAPLTKVIGRNYYEVVKLREGCAGALDYLETLIALQEMSDGERMEMRAFHHTLCGNYAETVSVIERYQKEAPGVKTRVYLAVAYAKLGRREEALKIRDSLDELDSTATFYLRPYIHVALGDFDSAFADLEKGIAARDNRFLRFGTDELFEPLRSDTRFKHLLSKINVAG